MGSRQDWINEQQGKHFCQCDCGEPITILARHFVGTGIARYKIGHHVKRGISVKKWLAENQNKHICACGCGRFIKITKWHRENHVPKYIHGHSKGSPLDMWVQQEQGKHLCSCGCDKAIRIQRDFRRHGIPRFILGHNSKGPGNAAWQGGKSKTYTTRRHASVPESWRQSVYLRDGHQCVQCHSNKRPHAHHIISFAKRPDLGNKLWNGITLCESCHRSVKGREANYETEFLTLLSRG